MTMGANKINSTSFWMGPPLREISEAEQSAVDAQNYLAPHLKHSPLHRVQKGETDEERLVEDVALLFLCGRAE